MQEEPGPTKEAGVRQGPTLAGTWGKRGCPGISGLEPKSWQLWNLLPALPLRDVQSSLRGCSKAAPFVSKSHKLMGPKPSEGLVLPRVVQRLERRR